MFESVKKQLEEIPNIIENIRNKFVNEIGMIADSIFEKCKSFFDFIKDLNNRFGGVFDAIFSPFKKTMELIDIALDLWRKLGVIVQIQESHKSKEQQVIEAINYTNKKLIRAFKTTLFRLFFNAVSGISRLVTYLSGGASAIVTEILELSSDIVLNLEGVGRKFKGIYKFMQGTRGINRLKNANIIVTFALNDDPDADNFMTTFFPASQPPSGNLVWGRGYRLNDVEEHSKWVNALAEKLKSQPT